MFAYCQVVESSSIGESLSRVRKVESNVDSSEQQLATDFLFGTADDGAQRPVPRIRGVRLDRTIGEGAFGVVWLGEQFDPVVRPVAVKILRVSSLGAHGMRRFEAEKTALARLEHPHIAHILDAGTASDGSPFLVMEFVEGTAFDAWCHRHRDSLPTRVRMLVLICRAIAYAHRQGILHRDLKPANVLVRAAGGIGESGAIEEPKIIDFGVAKLIGFDALRTETMQRPTAATPAYMSPEVAVGSAEIDGRVDVWSLGVMLFEALVGSRPFHTERSGMAGALDLQRQITELRAKRPSDALAPSAPRALRIALEDDLDWIALRALEKEPARRYLTPDELADDLERWLAGDAVSARPPSRTYRLRKFVRRNKSAIVATSIVALAFAVGVGGLVAGYVESSRQVDRWREIAALNRAMLTAIDPAVAQGLDARLTHLVLDEAIAELDRTPRDPIVEGEIRFSVGAGLAATGDFEAALEHFNRVRTLRMNAGATVDETAIREVDNAIGAALTASGRLDEAEPRLIDAATGDDETAANARHNLASLARVRGALPHAEALLREALAMKAALQTQQRLSSRSSILASEQELALVMAAQGRYIESEALARKVHREKLATLGAKHPDSLRAANNLAEALLALNEQEEARELLAGCVPIMVTVLGDMHPDTLSARNNYAGALRATGSLTEATDLYQTNRIAFTLTRGASDARTILAGANLAHCLNAMHRTVEAEDVFRDTASTALRALGPTHRVTLANDANYAVLLTDAARYAEAVVLLERAVPLIEQELGRAHQQCLAARTTLARARLGLGQPQRALDALAEIEAIVQTQVGGANSAGIRRLDAITRCCVETAAEAATALGDRARADRLKAILAKSPEDI